MCVCVCVCVCVCFRANEYGVCVCLCVFVCMCASAFVTGAEGEPCTLNLMRGLEEFNVECIRVSPVRFRKFCIDFLMCSV